MPHPTNQPTFTPPSDMPKPSPRGRDPWPGPGSAPWPRRCRRRSAWANSAAAAQPRSAPAADAPLRSPETHLGTVQYMVLFISYMFNIIYLLHIYIYILGKVQYMVLFISYYVKYISQTIPTPLGPSNPFGTSR